MERAKLRGPLVLCFELLRSTLVGLPRPAPLSALSLDVAMSDFFLGLVVESDFRKADEAVNVRGEAVEGSRSVRYPTFGTCPGEGGGAIDFLRGGLSEDGLGVSDGDGKINLVGSSAIGDVGGLWVISNIGASGTG